MKSLILFLLTFALAVAQSVPQPFGLRLGESTRQEVESVIRKEGGRITESGYRIIKGDIVNPNVEGIKVINLPVENLTEATFWFYGGRLFMIEYTFPLSMSKEEFYVVFKRETSKPKRGL